MAILFHGEHLTMRCRWCRSRFHAWLHPLLSSLGPRWGGDKGDRKIVVRNLVRQVYAEARGWFVELCKLGAVIAVAHFVLKYW